MILCDLVDAFYAHIAPGDACVVVGYTYSDQVNMVDLIDATRAFVEVCDEKLWFVKPVLPGVHVTYPQYNIITVDFISTEVVRV